MLKEIIKLKKSKKIKILGLMSGTSADGLDVACVEFLGKDKYPEFKVTANAYIPYPEKFADAFKRPLELSATDILEYDMELGHWYGRVIAELDMDFDLIASHGQTLLHNPPAYTLQIGEAQCIADRTARPVVYDFRKADLVAGGQGAPLIPIVDEFLLRKEDEDIIALNMGGIANISYLPSRKSKGQILAFDTGPANTLIDKAVIAFTDGREMFDRDGLYASQAKADKTLLNGLMSHPYYSRPLPKSAGQEQFGYDYFRELINKVAPKSKEEWLTLISTFSELTVLTIANEIKDIYRSNKRDIKVLVSGGGALNQYIMTRLSEELSPMIVEKFKHQELDSDLKEAFGFAYLAYLFIRDIPGNIAGVTGSNYPVVLGKFLSPNCRSNS